jgi:hypothetical protein
LAAISPHLDPDAVAVLMDDSSGFDWSDAGEGRREVKSEWDDPFVSEEPWALLVALM